MAASIQLQQAIDLQQDPAYNAGLLASLERLEGLDFEYHLGIYASRRAVEEERAAEQREGFRGDEGC